MVESKQAWMDMVLKRLKWLKKIKQIVNNFKDMILMVILFRKMIIFLWVCKTW